MELLKYGLFLPLIGISFIPAYQGEEIIGGHDVIPHSKPHMASIQRFEKGKYQHYCGGALISRNWVLTAAHCEINRSKQPLRVVLGAHSLSQDEESQQSLSVLNQVPYPEFNWQTKQNDIMLLKLKGAASLNKFVNILKLPNSKDVKSGTVCNVAGWGVINTTKQQLPKVLQEVNVTVINRSLCSKYYNYHPAITTNVLCAGDKKGFKDACQGDSGGPLLCRGNFNGIVSFGCGCGNPKKPGIYTRLSAKYLPWIKKTISNSDFHCQIHLPTVHKLIATMNCQALLSSLTIIFYLTASLDCSEIIGGQKTINHARPYMASIQMNKQHVCGGVLIKPSWILTAAHCNLDFKLKPVCAVLGINSLKSNENSQQVLKVKHKIPHECFDIETKEHDIMLLQLESKAKLNKFVEILPLPQNDQEVQEGTVCTVAGWGATTKNSKRASDSLREVNVTIINRDKCNSRMYYNHKPVISKNMLCAGDIGGKRDACIGDSGGPLICNNKFRGIVSFGKKCGLPQKPGVYTRITNNYIKWIQDITA
ncbi:uncharacterized protein LOC144601103 [Rhinoraja longicauda]